LTPRYRGGHLAALADKAAANAAKHGVRFEEAVTVFQDLDYLVVRDALEPERLVAMGSLRPGRPCRRAAGTVD
jgi:uncharacterized DUF497 family protein